jgi:hypothetical protein
VTVIGGSLSNLTGSGANYTATFTPTADSTTGASISLVDGSFTDLAGNLNADGGDDNNTLALTVDTVRPTVAISSSATALKAGETATITFSFSEAVSNFNLDAVSVSGGSLSDLARIDETNSYTATFTPTADSTTDASISLVSGSFTDLAGNANADGDDPDNTLALTVDTAAPTVVITDNTAGVANGDVIFTFTFSEAVNGFTAEDITLSAGTPGAFTGNDGGTVYTLVVIPPSDQEGRKHHNTSFTHKRTPVTERNSKLNSSTSFRTFFALSLSGFLFLSRKR